jgi:GTPase SAR1 family protein
MQIWDTAGQDKYKTITQSYYNGSNGVIVAYGVDSRTSFNSVSTNILNIRGLDYRPERESQKQLSDYIDSQ